MGQTAYRFLDKITVEAYGKGIEEMVNLVEKSALHIAEFLGKTYSFKVCGF